MQPAARCSRAYANAHTYHINSISMSSDQETFLSSDDLRINLWHLDVSDCSFNILDIKPSSMEELTEVRVFFFGLLCNASAGSGLACSAVDHCSYMPEHRAPMLLDISQEVLTRLCKTVIQEGSTAC